MGVLRKKEERTETVTVRVPSRVKVELDRLREETSTAGFDLNATLSDAVVRVTKQIREELRRSGVGVGLSAAQRRGGDGGGRSGGSRAERGGAECLGRRAR
jgi:hypothetical protein